MAVAWRLCCWCVQSTVAGFSNSDVMTPVTWLLCCWRSCRPAPPRSVSFSTSLSFEIESFIMKALLGQVKAEKIFWLCTAGFLWRQLWCTKTRVHAFFLLILFRYVTLPLNFDTACGHFEYMFIQILAGKHCFRSIDNFQVCWSVWS